MSKIVISKEDFVELVCAYTVRGCDDENIKALTDKEREIVALAERDSREVSLEDMEKDPEVEYWYKEFIALKTKEKKN